MNIFVDLEDLSYEDNDKIVDVILVIEIIGEKKIRLSMLF